MRSVIPLVLLTGCATAAPTQEGPNVAGKVAGNPACVVSCKTSVTVTNVRDNEGGTTVDKDTVKTSEAPPK